MILTYEAVDAGGRRTRDTVEAGDVKEAVDQLRRKGLYVSRITEDDGAASRKAPAPTAGAGVRLPLKTTAVITRQMAMLLRAGSSIVPTIAAIQRQTGKPDEAALLGGLVADLEQGVTLTEALRKHPRTFDPVYCAVVAAGEASATLPEMFERLSQIVGKRRAIRNRIVGALTYPALLIAMSVHIVGALMFFVIPRFGDMFTQLDVDPPYTTKVMLHASTAMHSYWPYLLVGAVTFLAAVVAFLASDRGKQWLADVQLSLPFVRRVRGGLIQAQVFRTMGTLLESGVGVLDTFELARQSTRNRRFQKLFDDLEQSVTSGGGLAPSFEASRLVQPYVCQAIHTGEDSGNLGGALSYAADLLDEINDELIATTMKLVEPVILIGLGFVVGGVAISLFMPLFDMTAAMN